MAKLCFVMTCKGRLGHLRQSLPRVVEQHDCSCVVVDYSCPDQAGDWVQKHYPQVRVVRVEGRPTFSRSSANNAGAREADARWLCFLDADILLEPSFASTVLPLLEPGHYYRANPLKDWATFGTFICGRRAFERIGGFDELFQGYGGEDVEVYQALDFIGMKRQSFPSALLQHIAHEDEARTQHHDQKDRGLTISINNVYRIIKFDLIRLQSKFISQEARITLYNRVQAAILQARQGQGTVELTISTPDPRLSVLGTLQRSLVYHFTWNAAAGLLLNKPPPGFDGDRPRSPDED